MAFTKITGPGIHTLSNIMSHNVKSSGIITAVNGNLTGWLAVGSTASFGGNVSIGGTLTYDDVTNVESVGIITAKAGIHVGAGGSIIHALSEDDGAVGVNNLTPSSQYYKNLVVGSNNAGSWGITVRTNSANSGNLAFSDTDSANAGRYDGRISYEHTDQSMRFHTNAAAGGTTEKLRITGIGSVGIGTNNPQAQLEVYKVGTGVTATSVVRGENAVFAIMGDATNTGASETDARLVFSSDGDVSPSKILTSPLATHGFEIALINEEPGAGLRFHDGTANTERLRIHTTGWQQSHAGYAAVGINTFASWARTGGAIRAEVGYNAVTTDYMYFGTGTAHPLALRTSNTTALYIDTNQKVGIGTEVPSDMLHVVGSGRFIKTSNNYVHVGSSNAGGAAIVLDGDSNGDGTGADYAYIEHDTSGNLNIVVDNPANAGDIKFFTNTSSERLRINSAGVVTSFATHPQIILRDPDGRQVSLRSPSTINLAALGTDSNHALCFYTNGYDNERIRITNEGDVGIGTDTVDFKFQVQTGTHKFISFTDAEHGSLGTLGSAIIFSRPQDGAKKICGIFQHTNQSLAIAARDDLTFHTGGNAFYYSGSERLRINSIGICSITTPGNTQEGTYYTTLTINNTGTDTWSRLRFDRSGVAKWGLSLGTDDKFRITNLYTDGSAASPDDDCLVISNTSKISIGEDDPEDNHVLIRGSSTVATKSGHIMLTGDSAIIDEGPQIVFAESGATSSYAGGYVGFKRTGTNSIGQLVFGTRGEAGNANTVPSERLRINSNGKFTINNGASEYASGTLQNVDQNEWQVCDPVIQWSLYGAVGAILMVVYENNNADGNNCGAYFVGPATSAYGGATTTPFTRFSGSDTIEAKIDQVGGTGNYKLHLRTTHSSADGNSHKFLRWAIVRVHSL